MFFIIIEMIVKFVCAICLYIHYIIIIMINLQQQQHEKKKKKKNMQCNNWAKF